MPPEQSQVSLEALAVRGEAVRRGVQDFLARSAERRAWAQELGAALPPLLAELARRSAARRDECEGLARQLADWPGAVAEGELAVAAPALGDALSAARRVHADVAAALTGLPERTRVRHERLALRANEVAEGARALGGRVAGVGAAVSEGVERFGGALQALAEETGANVEEAARVLAEGATVDAAKSNPPGHDARGSGAESDLHELSVRVASFQGRVEAASKDVATALAALGDHLGQTTDELRQSRAEIEPLLEQVRRKLGPLERAIERVKETALTMGIF